MKAFVSGTMATLAAMLLMASLVPASAHAETGFYIGASAGGASLEADLNDISLPGLPSSIDEDDTALKVFVGYNVELLVVDLGVEAGYVDFGEPDIDILGDQLLLDTSGFNLWGIAALDVGPFQVFGKLGYIAWDVDADFLGQSASDDGSDIGYGAGLRFDVGPVQLRGEYELYDIDETDIGMLSLGISYLFD
jgi:hypothetical protein